MIQRIQTVYLLIVAIFMVLMMSFSVGHFYTETSVSDMTNLAVIAPDGTMNYAPWALFAILMVVAILSLVTIFLYRKRMLQIRLTLFSSIILVGYYVTLAAFVWGTLKECGSFTPSWTLCLPLISLYKWRNREIFCKSDRVFKNRSASAGRNSDCYSYIQYRRYGFL